MWRFIPKTVAPYRGRATAVAAALTQRLLAFSRRQTLDPKPTDVNRLVGGMEELIRRTVGPTVELEVVGAGGLWATKVDPSQLENALLNLCINARDAMAPDGGRLTIETANKWLDESMFRINLRRLLHLNGELALAEKIYREAKHASALLSFNLAILLEDLSREEEAIVTYRDALALDPSLHDAHFNLSRLHERAERPREALRHLLAYRHQTKEERD